MFDQNMIVGLVVIAVIGLAIYTYWPMLARKAGIEKFADASGMKVPAAIKTPASNGSVGGVMNSAQAKVDPKMPMVAPAPAPAPAPAAKAAEGFADFAGDDGMASVPMAGAKKPAGCYPREQLTPSELLPHDANSTWAQVNPAGAGDIQGKNFLSAGALVGVNTIGQSLRNANYQLRAEPPNPQVQVSPWQVSTIEPDLARRPLE